MENKMQLCKNLIEKFGITTFEQLNKGWSADKKYIIETADGKKQLLRIANIKGHDRKKHEFEMMQRIAVLGIPMSQPIEFGVCADDGTVYQLLSWVEGEDAITALPLLSETEQYLLGIKSGEILRKIHSIPAPDNQVDWETRYNKKINNRITANQECADQGLIVCGMEYMQSYVENNRHLLKGRPQCFQHGDYHVGNMLIENGKLAIIDFNRCDFGDPWEEFNRITFSGAASPHFATGQLHGYFDGEPPEGFFELLAFYTAANYLGGLSWARMFGEEEIAFARKQFAEILSWYNNMQETVPSWYINDIYIQWADGIPYKLKGPYDFTFLNKYGKVFKVFDEQGSGNIAFGIESDGQSSPFFVKFAGAPIQNYFADSDGAINTQDAIDRLKYSVQLYKDLEHPNLIKFLDAEEIGGGFATIFKYSDAKGIEPLNSPNYMKFMQLPIEKKMQAFEDIVDFHIHVAAKGYVALDFYDGSILYDYERDKVIICDIDTYQKSPYVGDLGLMGSARYVSPEECAKDTEMDEITNVYTMGATAFSLFAYGNRSHDAWPLSMTMYDVAKKAINDDRVDRQQTIKQFITEWRAAM